MNAPHPETAAPGKQNPGDTLRRTRESKGWSLAMVAQQLNLSERSLGQIEAGDFSQQPGHTFARGYVRAYAKLLGLDQNRLVNEFDQFTGTDASGSNVHTLGRIEEPVRLSHNVLRSFSFLLLLVLGGAGLFWWQNQPARSESGGVSSSLEHIEVEGADGTTQIHTLDEPEDQAVAAAEQDEPPLPTSGELAETDEGDEVAALSAAGDVLAAPATAAAAEEIATGEATTASQERAEADQPAADGAVQAAGEARLELKFNADCWTRITDSEGRTLLNGLIRGGTTRVLSGTPPLDLHFGYASGVQVTYNGDAVSLAPHRRGEIARLKLGQ